jgi:hypothetical protein
MLAFGGGAGGCLPARRRCVCLVLRGPSLCPCWLGVPFPPKATVGDCVSLCPHPATPPPPLAPLHLSLPLHPLFTLQTNKHTGLNDAVVRERFEFFGFNELAEKKVHPLLRFLSYFWAPMPIMVRRSAPACFPCRLCTGSNTCVCVGTSPSTHCGREAGVTVPGLCVVLAHGRPPVWLSRWPPRVCPTSHVAHACSVPQIWTAALVELIKAASTGEGWPDFVVLLILQFANGMVGPCCHPTPLLTLPPTSCSTLRTGTVNWVCELRCSIALLVVGVDVGRRRGAGGR